MESKKCMENVNVFSALSDDLILKIFQKLEDDPRHWACLASVCTRFSSLIRNSCCNNNCSHSHTIPSDLLSASAPSLHKLAVCCPGLLHAGLLLHDSSDFGLHRDLGPHHPLPLPHPPSSPPIPIDVASASEPNCYWSLFDDLYYDTVYNASESESVSEPPPHSHLSEEVHQGVVFNGCNKSKICGSWSSHLASGSWNLSREQGSKLLARQFRDDCLYVCDWPGCVHVEEKRKYRIFRGVFKDFKRTRVWRTINDGNRKKLDLGCAFCLCEETWDLHSAFCLRRGFGYHDDGEPVVRAFVCENGHVSGAWTDVPIWWHIACFSRGRRRVFSQFQVVSVEVIKKEIGQYQIANPACAIGIGITLLFSVVYGLPMMAFHIF